MNDTAKCVRCGKTRSVANLAYINDMPYCHPAHSSDDTCYMRGTAAEYYATRNDKRFDTVRELAATARPWWVPSGEWVALIAAIAVGLNMLEGDWAGAVFCLLVFGPMALSVGWYDRKLTGVEEADFERRRAEHDRFSKYMDERGADRRRYYDEQRARRAAERAALRDKREALHDLIDELVGEDDE